MKRASLAAHKVFNPYYKIGGVLHFLVYDDASDDPATARSAIEKTLLQAGRVNKTSLAALSPQSLTEAEFFGDWYNPSDKSLVWNGSVTTADGMLLINPTFNVLSGLKVVSSGAAIPDFDNTGQFAYAFANPPYPLNARRDEIQRIFDSVRETLLPPGNPCKILDWTGPELDKVSRYFEMGKEWWGMFLFTIYNHTSRQLTVIVGSASD